VKDSFDYYVERYDDSLHPFIKDRFVRIEPEDFGKYQINGISLTKFIGEKFSEMYSGNSPLRFKLRPVISENSPSDAI
jgi:hypothetical protein